MSALDSPPRGDFRSIPSTPSTGRVEDELLTPSNALKVHAITMDAPARVARVKTERRATSCRGEPSGQIPETPVATGFRESKLLVIPSKHARTR